VALTELILSEITRMDPGFCVIGIKPDAQGFRSVRSGPPYGHAWADSFPYKRGDKLQFSLSNIPVLRPHVEDRQSSGVLAKLGELTESELLAYLRRAEFGSCLRELFGCQVRIKRRGAFVIGKLALRSICGAEPQNVRLKWEAGSLRAAVALPSGESLPDLPVVDRSWLAFAEAVMAEIKGANTAQRLNRHLAQRLQLAALDGKSHFLRIGLARPRPNACWLMVDTLFPFPRKSWLNEFKGAKSA
jgi:hypothetical protein